MERHVIIVLTLLIATTVAPSPDKQYRSDYEYDQNTDAFYKLHENVLQHSDAKRICSYEGAQLVDPKFPKEIIQVHVMMKKVPDFKTGVWLLDGTRSDADSDEEQPVVNLSPTHMVIEESNGSSASYCEVLTQNGHIDAVPCSRPMPFVCKVSRKDAPYNSQCRVYSNNYNFSSAVGSCYRVSRYAATWNEAYSECTAEGAHLIVLNSVTENQYIMNLLKSTHRVLGCRANEYYFFFAGIRANKPTDGSQRVFRTVFNTTLQEAGYAEWSDGEPNNYADSEYCGCLFAGNGKYNDISCTTLLGFVCEADVH